MPMVIARPSSILKLKGLEISIQTFYLNGSDLEMILYYTKLFVESLRKAKRYFTDVNGTLNSDKTQRSILHATRAQQYAAHPALTEPSGRLQSLRYPLSVSGFLNSWYDSSNDSSPHWLNNSISQSCVLNAPAPHD